MNLRIVAGSIGLGVVVCGLVPCARLLRHRLVPNWTGGIAALASSLLVLWLIVVPLEMLGLVGWFSPVPILASLALVGIGGYFAARFESGRHGVERAAPGRTEPIVRPQGFEAAQRAAAVISVAAVAASWAARTSSSVRSGMHVNDSLFYHMTTAADIAQSEGLLNLNPVSDHSLAQYLPSNSPMLHAFGMSLEGSDVLSPFFQMGWLALALLAAWCVGKPAGLGPMTLAAGAASMGVPGIAQFQPGEALTDVATAGLFFAGLALLLNGQGEEGRLDRGALALAALAFGLALGTKTNIVPIVVVFVAFVALVPNRFEFRMRLTILSLVGAVVGGFWYARNLIEFGNPFALLGIGVGPFGTPEFDTPIRSTFLVDDVFRWELWNRIFVPSLARYFGSAWLIVLASSGFGLGLVAWKGPTRLHRRLGAAGLASAGLYLVLPLPWTWTNDNPVFFEGNIRYTMVLPLLGLTMLPVALDSIRGCSRPEVVGGMLLVLAVIVAGSQWRVWVSSTDALTLRSPDRVVGVLAFLLSLTVGSVLVRVALPESTTTSRIVIGVVSVVGVIGAAYVSRGFLDDRYVGGEQASSSYFSSGDWQIPEIFRWAAATEDLRIGVVGIGEQYPLYGSRLSNEVQYLVSPRPNGGGGPASDCAEWRTLVNQAHLDVVVVGSTSFPILNTGAAPELGWTASDPSAVLLIEEADYLGLQRSVALFRLDGTLDPDACR